ncbi:MAG: Mini-ribonuclease 3 [Ruminococcus sp.]
MDTLTMTDNKNPRNMSSLSLAFVGDSVYDLLVREHLALCDGRRVGELNKAKVSMVCCKAQSEAYAIIAPILTEEEQEVFHRGRNVKVHSVPKNSSLQDYHNATGFEALFGYLYLSKRENRLRELFSVIVNFNNE